MHQEGNEKQGGGGSQQDAFQQETPQRRRPEKRKVDDDVSVDAVAGVVVAAPAASAGGTAGGQPSSSSSSSSTPAAAAAAAAAPASSQQRSKRKASAPTPAVLRANKRLRRSVKSNCGGAKAVDDVCCGGAGGAGGAQLRQPSRFVVMKSPKTDPRNMAMMATEVLRARLDEAYPLQMPADFFDLYTQCAFRNSSFPKLALVDLLGIRLCGPYDYSDTHIDNWSLHCRYFYDLPQFTTVAEHVCDRGVHLGYYRDSPAAAPAFVAVNDEAASNRFKRLGTDVFSALIAFSAIKRDTRLTIKAAPPPPPPAGAGGGGGVEAMTTQPPPPPPPPLTPLEDLELMLSEEAGECGAGGGGRMRRRRQTDNDDEQIDCCLLVNGLTLHVPRDTRQTALHTVMLSMPNEHFLAMLEHLLKQRDNNHDADHNDHVLAEAATSTNAAKALEAQRTRADADMKATLKMCKKAATNQHYPFVLQTALNLFLFGDARLDQHAQKLANTAFNIMGPAYALFATIIDNHLADGNRKFISNPPQQSPLQQPRTHQQRPALVVDATTTTNAAPAPAGENKQHSHEGGGGGGGGGSTSDDSPCPTGRQ